jgi:DNA polymerase-3 subunit epsilon
VLVAHNAPFDLGFLKAGCERLDLDWPAPDSVDTARLARRVLTRDEAPNCKLATLARLFRSGTTPDHRALSDARATVDVLHGLLARVGGLGVQSLEELRTFSSQVSPQQRRKRHLADGLPAAPGVYLFRDARGRVLYVGKSTNLRGRVRQYFTASETRTRMAEMVGLAEQVDPVVCSTPLEAEVRELRLIAEHSPRYNRRSKRPDKATWIKLTTDAFPRLSLVRTVLADDALYLGPFGPSCDRRAGRGRGARGAAAAAVHQADLGAGPRQRLRAGRDAPLRGALPRSWGRRVSSVVRRARTRLPDRRRRRPLSGRRAADQPHPRPVGRAALRGRGRAAGPVDRLRPRRRAAAAADVADVGPPDGGGPSHAELGWEFAVVRLGRLVAAGTVARGVRPGPTVDALIATAETVLPRPGPLPAATAEEWSASCAGSRRPGPDWCGWRAPGRLPPSEPVGSAPGWRQRRTPARRLRPFDDRRRLRPEARPARALRRPVDEPLPLPCRRRPARSVLDPGPG